MSKINDGGPAFPRPTSFKEQGTTGVRVISCDEGMTLRDWFAGQALPEFATLISIKHPDETAKVIAKLSYKMADAMLAAREAQP